MVIATYVCTEQYLSQLDPNLKPSWLASNYPVAMIIDWSYLIFHQLRAPAFTGNKFFNMFCFLLGLKSIHVTFLSLRFIDYFVHISSTRRWINADLLLYHRLRRWPNIKAALVKR